MYSGTCGDCATEIATIASRYTQQSTSHADVPVVVRAQDRQQWNKYVNPSFGRPPTRVGVMDMAYNTRVLDLLRAPKQRGSLCFRVVYVYAPDLDKSRRAFGGRQAARHCAVWSRLLGFVAASALVSLLQQGPRHAVSWHVTATMITAVPPAVPALSIDRSASSDTPVRPPDPPHSLYTGISEFRQREATLLQLPAAMRQRVGVYNAICRMLITKDSTAKNVARQDAFVAVMRLRDSSNAVFNDASSFRMLHWLCYEYAGGSMLRPVFEECEDWIARFRLEQYLQHLRVSNNSVSAELYVLRVLQQLYPRHGGCALICTDTVTREFVFRDQKETETRTDLPVACVRAWNPLPSFVYRVPFDSAIGLSYIRGSRLVNRGRGIRQTLSPTDDPCQSLNVDADAASLVQSRDHFQTARYVLHQGHVYVPDFAGIEAVVARVLSKSTPRMVWSSGIERRLRDVILHEFHGSGAFSSSTAVHTRVVSRSGDDSVATDKVVPASVDLQTCYRVFPPCVLPARPSLDPRMEHNSSTPTRLRGYDYDSSSETSRSRLKQVEVELRPRANRPRWMSYRVMARTSAIGPRRQSAMFGHNTLSDIRTAQSAASRQYQTRAVSCVSMQSMGSCPYMARSTEFKLDPQQRCMRDIQTLAGVSTTTTTTTTTATTSSSTAAAAGAVDSVGVGVVALSGDPRRTNHGCVVAHVTGSQPVYRGPAADDPDTAAATSAGKSTDTRGFHARATEPAAVQSVEHAIVTAAKLLGMH